MQTNINTTHNNLITKRITNWPEYNKSLKNRGNLSIFISEEIIKDGRIVMPKRTGKPGRPMEYTDELIEFILTIGQLFHLPLRQLTGFMEFLYDKMLGLDKNTVPDYTTIDKRMLGITVRYHKKVERAEGDGEGLVLLVDSSGFKVFGEGEWMIRKHGATYRRTWRETHLMTDYSSRDIVAIKNTSAHVHDNTQLKPLLRQVIKNKNKVLTVIGDGAYDSKNNYLLGRKLGIEFIAPPRKDAIEHLNSFHYQTYDVPGWEERNAVVRHIEEYGLDGWMADIDYHRRSLVENTFYRLKIIFGDHLKYRTKARQYTEQCIKAKILNQFNTLGLPKYEWIK